MHVKKDGCNRTARDMKWWKKKHEYGMRWIAEFAFSSMKRMLVNMYLL